MAEGGAVPAGGEAPRPGRDWARVATGLETGWDYPGLVLRCAYNPLSSSKELGQHDRSN